MNQAQRRGRYRVASAVGLLIGIGLVPVRGDSIWIEGEDATSRDVVKHPWYDVVRKEGMSGQEWLSHYSPKKEGRAAYAFDVVEGGDYTFWWRGNYQLASVLYSLDNSEFVAMDFSEKRGPYMISEKPDHRSLAWVRVGKLRLEPGKHHLTFRFNSKIANHGGIDCLCFVNTPFVPSGARKPGIQDNVAAGPGDWFPVVFGDDPFSPDSVIDMFRLVDAPAGKHGFLTRDGARLRFAGADRPVQFWGCGANIDASLPREKQTQRARYLRKHGVNMVRQHPLFGHLGPLENGEFDKGRLDQWDLWFSLLKEQGIYMTWSVFYPLTISRDDGYDPELFAEIKQKDGRGNTSGMVNFMRELQDLELTYLRKLLLHTNPYTRLRYIDDPALAVLEVQNEDCIFWHSPLNTLAANKPPKHAQRLRQLWCEWVRKQYGSEQAVKEAWGGLRRDESLARGELALYGAWEMTASGPKMNPREKKRLGDFVHFLTDLQRGFYRRREKELRSIGYKAVTVTTAWRAGGPAADPANLYCDTAMDMIDRHNYLGGGAGGHRIGLGKVNTESHLAQPGSGILASGMYQVENRPFSMTEWTSSPPNQWKLEIAPLFAFYGMGLQGWDASYHFLNSHTRIGDGWPNLSCYVTDTPHYIGQFPAIAFALHHRHVAEAPIAAGRRVRRDDLFLGLDVLSQDFSGGGYDAKALQGNLATPMEALAIGRVTTRFDGSKSERVDLDRYWDKAAKVVRSMTGQLLWDYGRQVVTVRTPKTQAIIGRAGGASFDLPGVRVAVKTPFVSLIFTPLDNVDLAASRHILITAMARDKQTGSRYSADGTELQVIGGPPLLMEPVQAAIRLKGVPPERITALDVYGVPTSREVGVKNGVFVIDGRYRTYYYEVKR